MLAVALTVNQAGDELIGSLAQICFQSSGRVLMDWINNDDASAGYGNQGEIKIVLEAIDIARNFGDGPPDVLCRSAGKADRERYSRQRTFNENFHSRCLFWLGMLYQRSLVLPALNITVALSVIAL